MTITLYYYIYLFTQLICNKEIYIYTLMKAKTNFNLSKKCDFVISIYITTPNSTILSTHLQHFITNFTIISTIYSI